MDPRVTSPVAGVAQGFAGGDGAERHQDVGDGVVSQDPCGGLQVHQPQQVQAIRQRAERGVSRGDAGGGQLQHPSAELSAHRVQVLQVGGGNVPVLARRLP